jgi:transcriptional regulator GlxA family with amidase domain
VVKTTQYADIALALEVVGMPRIAVVAPEGAFLSGASNVIDLFALANSYSVRQYSAVDEVKPPSSVQLLTERGAPCRLSCGRSLSADGAWGGGEHYDLVYVANFDVADEAALEQRLDQDARLIAWMSECRSRGALLSASGAGVFYLAETGVFGDGVATAPWWLERSFARRYPEATLDISRIIAESAGVLCAGTARGEPALAIRLAERVLSANVANWLAKTTLIDPYPDGAEPWTVFSPRVLREDGLVGRAQHWLQQRFSQKVRIADLASHLGVNTRKLERRFRGSLGMSPIAYLQQLRIEAAKHMLSRSSRKVERVAYLVGYSDAAFFKQVFREHTGVSPSAFRRNVGAAVRR